MGSIARKRYTLIYCDPPWSYHNKHISGGAANHYDTLSLKDLMCLDVKSIAADDSLLFMWCTMPQLRDGFRVMEAWGFQYKTMGFTWVKVNHDGSTPFKGLGFYTRGNAELCLMGTRGKGAALVKSHNVEQLIVTERGLHSSKPYVIYARLQELVGDVPKVELFARDTIDGWDHWSIEDGDIRGATGTTAVYTHNICCDNCGSHYQTTIQAFERMQVCPDCGCDPNGGKVTNAV